MSVIVNNQSERRRFPRRRVLKAALAMFNDGRSTISCNLRNVSATGSLLTVPNALSVPEEFDLFTSRSRRRLPCRVVWRRVGAVGVTFSAILLDPESL